MKIPLSVLDLAVINPGGSAGQSYAASVALARAVVARGARVTALDAFLPETGANEAVGPAVPMPVRSAYGWRDHHGR